MNTKHLIGWLSAVWMIGVGTAIAAPIGGGNQPVEISSDKLDVMQAEHQAIFSGNVIAVQGTTKMRAERMVVHYRDSKSGKGESAQGVSRIDAEGSVVFTTPMESARGDKGVYNVDTDTIELMGGSVTLTREQNILKGTHLTYNMKTGRSVLTSGGSQVTGSGTKPARVRGLFMPSNDKKTSD